VLDIADMPDGEARIQWVRERTAGRGADIVVNCATAGSFTEALRMTRTMAEARHFHQAIQFVATRGDKFDFSKLISNSYALARTGDALKAMEELREVKPLIVANAA
jgi:hypothetical protein